MNKVYVKPSGPPRGPDEPRLYISDDGLSGTIQNRGRTVRAERYLATIIRESGAYALHMNTAPDDRAAHGPFDTIEAAYAWWLENHEAPPLYTVSVGGTYITRTTAKPLNEWGFSDEPADTLPDDDPEVIAGMQNAAESRAAAEQLTEYRFGRPITR